MAESKNNVKVIENQFKSFIKDVIDVISENNQQFDFLGEDKSYFSLATSNNKKLETAFEEYSAKFKEYETALNSLKQENQKVLNKVFAKSGLQYRIIETAPNTIYSFILNSEGDSIISYLGKIDNFATDIFDKYLQDKAIRDTLLLEQAKLTKKSKKKRLSKEEISEAQLLQDNDDAVVYAKTEFDKYIPKITKLEKAYKKIDSEKEEFVNANKNVIDNIQNYAQNVYEIKYAKLLNNLKDILTNQKITGFVKKCFKDNEIYFNYEANAEDVIEIVNIASKIQNDKENPFFDLPLDKQVEIYNKAKSVYNAKTVGKETKEDASDAEKMQ